MPRLNIANRSLHYLDEGEGFPVLLGHSYLWQASMWGPQLDCLRKRYRVVVPELWGHGESGLLPEGTTKVGDLADHMLAFADALHLEEFVVLGLSVGGMWAAELALKAPDRVVALGLLDTFVGPEPAAAQAMFFGMIDRVEQGQAFPPPLAREIAPLFFAPQTPVPEEKEAFTQRLVEISAERIASIVALGRMIFGRRDMLAELAKIAVPCLVLTGEQDIPRPVSEAKQMVAVLPNATFVEIAGAGHISTIERPQAVNSALTAFLAGAIEGDVPMSG
ncbi:MAG: alpha/beta fold hydrolase [Nannocystaceae bacterium]